MIYMQKIFSILFLIMNRISDWLGSKRGINSLGIGFIRMVAINKLS